MKKYKPKRKHLYYAVILAVVLFLMNLGFGIWAKSSFPKFIAKKNDTAYNIIYEDLDYSLIRGGLVLKNLSIYPKEDSIGKLKTDFRADIEEFTISGVSFYKLIFKEKLKANQIRVKKPSIKFYRTQFQNTNTSKSEFQNSIQIESLAFDQAMFQYIDEDRETLVGSVDNLGIIIKGVRLDKNTLEKKLPFGFSSYNLSCDDFFYQLNPSQQIRSTRLEFKDNLLNLKGFRIETTDTLAVEHSVENGYKLLPAVDSKEFKIDGMDWGFSKEDKFYFKSSKISFDSAFVNIAENQNKTQKEKPLKNLIPFLIEVGNVEVVNSGLVVENDIKLKEINLKIGNIRTDENYKLEMDTISFESPVISLFPPRQIEEIKEILISPFREHVNIEKLKLNKAKIYRFDPSEKTETLVTEDLYLSLNGIEVFPKNNFNKRLHNDNFIIRVRELKLKTDSILIDDLGISKNKKSKKNLLPNNIEIGQIAVQINKIENRNKFSIQPLKLEAENLKTDVGGTAKLKFIGLEEPEIIFYSKSKNKSKTAEKALSSFVEIEQLKISNADFKFLNNRKKKLLELNQINLNLGRITSSVKNPFQYKDIQLTAASVNYRPEGNYDLMAENLTFDNQSLKFSQFKMKPRLTKSQFVRSLKKEKDYYDLKASEFNIISPEFDFSGNNFSFKTPQIRINGMDAYIYRSKIPADDTSKKKMYSQLLREMKFGMEVKKLNIQNSKLVYDEETTDSKGAGRLTFDNFNAEISNLNSGYQRARLPDVRAIIKTDFMNESKLSVIWTFNPMDRSEKFNIRGSIYNFDAEKMTPFIKPYLHATAEGKINEVSFNFTGNNQSAKGDFGIKYENLRATLYNPNTGQPRKTLSTIGNLALKSNTKNQLIEIIIKQVDRKQDKSFFNFFWLCVQQGLKQTVLII